MAVSTLVLVKLCFNDLQNACKGMLQAFSPAPFFTILEILLGYKLLFVSALDVKTGTKWSIAISGMKEEKAHSFCFKVPGIFVTDVVGQE